MSSVLGKRGIRLELAATYINVSRAKSSSMLGTFRGSLVDTTNVSPHSRGFPAESSKRKSSSFAKSAG